MEKVSQEMADMKTIREADERWRHLLFGEPYEARLQSGAVHVYDGNSDEILTYTAGVGWHEKETQVHGALKAAYYDAYYAARQEINAGAVEMQGGFDAGA